jgi:hypothetical protein
VSGPVDEQHLGAALEWLEECHHRIAQITAGTVDEDERRQVRAFGSWHVDAVEPEPADIDQFADIGIALADLPRLPLGE